jgi:hypothetical protein
MKPTLVLLCQHDLPAMFASTDDDLPSQDNMPMASFQSSTSRMSIVLGAWQPQREMQKV